MAVEDEVPMEMVLEPSITTAESPEIFVPVKVRDAKANETPPARTAMPIAAAKRRKRGFRRDDLSCMAPSGLVYVSNDRRTPEKRKCLRDGDGHVGILWGEAVEAAQEL